MDNRIVVIDDDPAVREVADGYLRSAGFLIHYAFTGREGLDLVRLKAPSAIVLDLGLPDIGGREVCQDVRRRSDVPILMLTGRGELEDIVAGFDCGADDYLTKPVQPRELVARVQALVRRSGKAPLTPVIRLDDGAVELDSVRHEVTRDGRRVDVTPTEFRLLLALAQHPGRAYSRAELLNHAQGDDFAGYERTIDAHITNLRHKLERDPRSPRYIETVRGVGYRLGVEPT